MGPYTVDDKVIRGEKEMADILSRQYEDICSVPRMDIKNREFIKDMIENDTTENVPVIDDIVVCEDDVRKIIGKLSNSAAMGPDRLLVHVFKHGGDYVVKAVSDIVRFSITEGSIPRILKVGWITPIWKGEDREDPINYRPISLTSHLGKIIVRVIRIKITEHLVDNNLLEDSQHGSRSGRGTLTQLLNQHDILVEKLSHRKNVDLAYLDFSKAFDFVDHSILLQKVKKKGIRGRLLNWLREFLTDRVQCVRVGQVLSKDTPLHSGVPQGSVLGLLLFLVFIGDLEEGLENVAVSVLKYVDDSKLIIDVESEKDVAAAQSSLEKVYQWANDNNMRWNNTKLKILRLGSNEKLKAETEYFNPDHENIIKKTKIR